MLSYLLSFCSISSLAVLLETQKLSIKRCEKTEDGGGKRKIDPF